MSTMKYARDSENSTEIRHGSRMIASTTRPPDAPWMIGIAHDHSWWPLNMRPIR